MNQESSTQAGHDAPLTDQSLDYFNRWPTATAISRVILASPSSWSTRIGIYGSWGEGKTSVLNFLERQQRAVGNVVVRYSPWGAYSESDVWRDVGRAIDSALRANGLQIRWKDRAIQWLKQRKETLSGVARTAGRGTEAAFGIPGASIGGEVVSRGLDRALRFSKKDVEILTKNLGERRIVVFIDDLDRTDPTLIPKILLSLRELLDFSSFVFVLAFDKEIVASSLASHNPAFGVGGQSFLDKVIDFPFSLPPPSRDQIESLARARFEALCPFVPEGGLTSICKLLPPNPRKLKLFARMVSSLTDEVARHSPEEIHWPVLLLVTLLQLENSAYAQRLISLTTAGSAQSWLFYAMADRPESKKKRQEKTRKLVAEYAVSPE